MPNLLDLAKNAFSQGAQTVSQTANPILDRIRSSSPGRFVQSATQTFSAPMQKFGDAIGFAVTSPFEQKRLSLDAQTDLNMQRLLQKRNDPRAKQYAQRSVINTRDFANQSRQKSLNAIAGAAGTGLTVIGAKGLNSVGGAIGTLGVPTLFSAGLSKLQGQDVSAGAGQGFGSALKLSGINSITNPILAKLNPGLAGAGLIKRTLIKGGANALSSIAENELQTRVDEQRGQTGKELLFAGGLGFATGAGGELIPAGTKAVGGIIKKSKQNIDENFLNRALQLEESITSQNGVQQRGIGGKYGGKVKLGKAIGSGGIIEKEIPLVYLNEPGNTGKGIRVAPSEIVRDPSLLQKYEYGGPANSAANKLMASVKQGGYVSTGLGKGKINLSEDSLVGNRLGNQLPQAEMIPSKPGIQQSSPTAELPQISVKEVSPSDYFNTKNLNIPEEAKVQVKADIEAVKPQIEKVVGNTLSNKEVVKTAEQTSKILDSAVGREQTLAWESAMLKARQKLAALAQSGTVDKEYIDTLVTVKSLGSDVARKLQSLSIGADPKLLTSKQAILEAVLKATDDSDKVLKAAQGVDFNDLGQATRFYRQFIQPTKGEWLDLLRYNSMLSSPNTHFNNIASNYQGTGIIAPIEKTITGGLDALKSALTGSERQYAVGEGAAYARGYYSNVSNALKSFTDVMSGKSLSESPDVRNIPFVASGIRGKIEGALKLPMNLLEASDRFFTTLTEGGENAAQAYKQSKGITFKGITSDEAAAKRLFRSDLGENQGSTVLDAIDSVAKKVNSFKNDKNPIVRNIAKFSLPFIKTPTNVLKQGVEYSPLGVTTLAGSTNKIEQLSKAVLGSTIGLGVATLVGSDRLTWAEPTSEKQKQLFRASGMQPYSVKIGNNWVSYSKLHPAVSFNFALVAGVRDALDKKKISDGEAETVLKGLAKWMQFYADQSYLKNVGDIISSVKGDIESPTRLASNYAQQVIPFRALMGWVTRIVDPYQRKIDPSGSILDKQLQQISTQIPLLSQTVPARLDTSGQPIPNQNRLINAFSPARVSTERKFESDMYKIYQNQLKQKNLESQTVSKLKEGAGGSGAVGDNFIYLNDKMEKQSIDLGKISSMPSSTNLEKVKKEKEVWSAAAKIMDSGVSEDEQALVLQKLGISKEDAQYYATAKSPNDEKTAYVLDNTASLDGKDLYNQLVDWRKPVNGSMILSDGVINNLVDEGKITYDQGRALKKIDYTSSGKRKTSSAKKGPKITVKAPTYKPIKLAAIKPIKIRKPKKLKFKKYKQRRIALA